MRNVAEGEGEERAPRLAGETPYPAPTAPPRAGGYGRGAGILSVGIATTGVVTFAYFSVASHVLDDPDHTAAEMARCARGGHLLASVPHEPLWRGLNLARGAYVKDLGNTPGHVNHWSRRGVEALLSRHGEVVETRSPFPWTMVLARV